MDMVTEILSQSGCAELAPPVRSLHLACATGAEIDFAAQEMIELLGSMEADDIVPMS